MSTINATARLTRPLIAIATYRRPEGLKRLLNSIRAQAHAGITILVVDNDEHPSSSRVISELQASGPPFTSRLEYVHEPDPGIAAARNRALEFFSRGDHDCIIFVDDDEYVSANWLFELMDAAHVHQADIVSGPVISILPLECPRWLREGGYHQRKKRLEGDAGWTAATNNTLLRRCAWEDLGRPTFNPRFSRTGGSDTDFFSRLHAAGAQIRFTARAEVYEDIPGDRLTIRWLSRRAYRSGLVNAIVFARDRSRPRIFLMGIASILIGALAICVDLVRFRFVTARNFTRVGYGVGLVGALVGAEVYEYTRQDAADA